MLPMGACANSATIQFVYVAIVQRIGQSLQIEHVHVDNRFREMKHGDKSIDDAVKEPQYGTDTVHFDVDLAHELQ